MVGAAAPVHLLRSYLFYRGVCTTYLREIAISYELWLWTGTYRSVALLDVYLARARHYGALRHSRQVHTSR